MQEILRHFQPCLLPLLCLGEWLTIGIPPSLAQSPPAPEADRQWQLCQTQWQSQAFEAAVTACQQAIQLYQAQGNRDAESLTWIGLGVAYNSLKQYPEAIAAHQQSLTLARAIGNPPREMMALANLGMNQALQGDRSTAIQTFQEGLALAQKLGDRRGELTFLGNLADLSYQLNAFEAVIGYQRQSLALLKELGDQPGQATAFYKLGFLYYSLGDYAQAIEMQSQSLKIAQAIDNTPQAIVALNYLSLSYYNLGDYDRAIDYQNQGLALAKTKGDRLGEASALTVLGLIYSAKNEYKQGLTYQEQSLALIREIGDRDGLTATLANLGGTYRNLGYYDKAIAAYQESLSLIQAAGDRRREMSVLANLGSLHRNQGTYSQAIDYYQKALALAQEFQDLNTIGYTLFNLGWVQFQAGQFSEAEQWLRRAIEARESLRAKLGSADALKVAIADMEISADTYLTLQQVLVAQGKTEAALEIAERGRSRAFLELLASRVAGSTPSSADLVPPTLNDLRQTARQHQATLVEYSIVFDDLYIWVIQPNGSIQFRRNSLKALGISIQEAAERSRLAAASDDWRGGSPQSEPELSQFIRGTRQDLKPGTSTPTAVEPGNPQPPAEPEEGDREINPRLNRSYQLLIAPIADLLPTDPQAPVIFIPHQSLFLVPFAALQDDRGTYLIEKHTVLLAPSIQILALTHQQRAKLQQQRSQESLIVGVPRQTTVVGNPIMPAIGHPPEPLTPLPGAETEAATIAQLLQTKPLLGAAATKATVLQQMGRSRLIHLATHGLLDDFGDRVPGAIALAPSAQDSGLLTTDEILGLQLQAELVVLSACDTGRGRITGDGVIGLSRAFVTAGVPSVIVSLWQVPDQPTALLMTHFYENLQKTNNKAQALREAMLVTMKKFPLPGDWAAFTLIGES